MREAFVNVTDSTVRNKKNKEPSDLQFKILLKMSIFISDVFHRIKTSWLQTLQTIIVESTFESKSCQ